MAHVEMLQARPQVRGGARLGASFAAAHPDTSFPHGAAGARAEVALVELQQSLGADHVSLLRRYEAAERFEVVAVAGAPFLAPGVSLPLASSTLLAATDIPCTDIPSISRDAAPLEAVARAQGMRRATALRVAHCDNAPRGAGALYLAWSEGTPTVAAVDEAVDEHAERLAMMLQPRPSENTPVLIAHPDTMVAEGIARCAERELGVVAQTCASLAEAVEAVGRSRFGLIVCSDRLAEDERLTSICARIRAAGAAAPVVALARTETRQGLNDALHAGIAGFVALTDGPARIVDVLDSVLDGQAVLPTPDDRHEVPLLTAREEDVLRALDRGLSYFAIANELEVAPSTVKSHARRLFRKLDVVSRTAALHRAREQGLL